MARTVDADQFHVALGEAENPFQFTFPALEVSDFAIKRFGLSAVEFEDHVAGSYVPGVVYAVRISAGVENDTVRSHPPSQSFELSFEKDDGGLVCMGMRCMPGAGGQSRGVRVQFPHTSGGSFEQER